MVLDDQARLHELGDVLTHGVVVEADASGELGDVDGVGRFRDVPEDAVAGRVTEGPSLLLQRRHASSPVPVDRQWPTPPSGCSTSPAWNTPTAPFDALANLWVTNG